jgi:hypothetical protein
MYRQACKREPRGLKQVAGLLFLSLSANEGDSVKRSAKAYSPLAPAASKAEAKQDATTRIAREIVDREAAAQAAKTARLRTARLARDAAAMPAAPVKAARARAQK